MNKVISMNLNGNAYQLEEPGYDALALYLSQARARLTDNPDCEEIMADLEQAVADKFGRFLSPHKSVITHEEVTTIIKEMGPVDGGTEAESSTPRPKRLYRIKEGSILGGVSTGLAAYLGLDVLVVRLVIIILTILSSGGLVFGYMLAWIFIPEARTEREQAEAKGAPFTAQEFITRAKTEYAKFDGRRTEWQKQWHDWRKEMKQQEKLHKAWARNQRHYYRGYHSSFFGELVGVVFFIFLAWVGYHHIDIVHDFMDATWAFWHHAADQIAQLILEHDPS